MAQHRAVADRPLGGMQPPANLLGASRRTDLVRADGRPQPGFRDELRRIPSWRNAWAVVFVWIQTIGVVALAVWWGNPVGYVLAFLLMGRADAQFAALMHEAAHGCCSPTSGSTTSSGGGSWGTRSSRHRRIPPCAHGPPSSRVRPRRTRHPAVLGLPDHAGELPPQARPRRHWAHRFRLFHDQFAPARWKDPPVRRTLLEILLVQAVLLGVAIAVASGGSTRCSGCSRT